MSERRGAARTTVRVFPNVTSRTGVLSWFLSKLSLGALGEGGVARPGLQTPVVVFYMLVTRYWNKVTNIVYFGECIISIQLFDIVINIQWLDGKIIISYQ